jgi:DNA modification methylase
MTFETNRYVIGDCREILRSVPDETFQCCVTSPPYWMQRDYQHPDQMGLEGSPEEWVAALVDVFREVRRTLRKDGSVYLNVGDGFAGNAGGGQGKSGQRATRTFTAKTRSKRSPGLKPKDMIGLPWMLAFSLRADGWWLRSEIVWAKANPVPESVTDRPTKSHEKVFLLSKSAKYFYDQLAVREPVSGGAHGRGDGVNPKSRAAAIGSKQNPSFSAAVSGLVEERNMRDVWALASEPYAGAHFATMPKELARRCILAGSAPGSCVLDPFLGSGTVGLVAESLDRRCFGCELNPGYAPLIAQRTAQVGMKFGVAK